jgi:hypothetical protein
MYVHHATQHVVFIATRPHGLLVDVQVGWREGARNGSKQEYMGANQHNRLMCWHACSYGRLAGWHAKMALVAP